MPLRYHAVIRSCNFIKWPLHIILPGFIYLSHCAVMKIMFTAEVIYCHTHLILY